MDLIRTVLTTVGILCFLQFVILGIYGIIIGHSVQNDITVNTALFGIFLTLFSKKHRNIFQWLLLFNVGLNLLNNHAEFSLPNTNVETGKTFYNQKQYEKAIVYFKGASEKYTWYLRFFNTSQYYQDRALWAISRTYIKIGDIDKAKEAYELARQQCPPGSNIITFEKFKEEADDPKYDSMW